MDFMFFGMEKYWVAWGILLLYLLFRFVLKVCKKIAPPQGVPSKTGKATEADVVRLIKNGEKIMAIKCYRELHGVGLAEAKHYVDSMAERMKKHEEDAV